jgi:hypothetical protein
MKREWEEEQERMMREAGLTKETLYRIEKWMDAVDNGCGCDSCVCGADDD